MKNLSITKILAAIGVTCLSILLGAGTTTAILEEGLSSAEAAGWVQALGSIAAIAAALYVWIGDRDERRQDQYAVALVASVDMTHSAGTCRHELYACVSLLTAAEELAYPRGTSMQVQARLQRLPQWTVEEIHRLSALGDCALFLARTQYSRHAAISAMDEALNSDRYDDLDFSSPIMSKAIDLLHTAEWNLDEALNAMVKAGKPEALAGYDSMFMQRVYKFLEKHKSQQ